MEGMNYLTAGDLALHSQEMRGGGYDGYYGYHRSGKGMAATGIGLLEITLLTLLSDCP